MATEFFVANSRAIRKDARETMALLKALHDSVGQELLESVLDLTTCGQLPLHQCGGWVSGRWYVPE